MSTSEEQSVSELLEKINKLEESHKRLRSVMLELLAIVAHLGAKVHNMAGGNNEK